MLFLPLQVGDSSTSPLQLEELANPTPPLRRQGLSNLTPPLQHQ